MFSKPVKTLQGAETTLDINDQIYQFEYSNTIKFRCDTTTKGVRNTIVLNKLGDTVNKQKTTRSLAPNIIHATDAIYAKNIINSFSVMAVHDEFLIRADTLPAVIDYANVQYASYIKQMAQTSQAGSTYNIFILL